MILLIITLLWFLAQIAFVTIAPPTFVVATFVLQAIPLSLTASDSSARMDTPFGQLNMLAVQVALLTFASALAISRQTGRSINYATRFWWHPCFLVLGLVSLSYAPSPEYGLRMLAKLCAPFLFMLAVLISINDEKTLRRADLAIVASGGILLGMALFVRALGINSDPNAVITGVAGLGPPGMGPPVFSAHMLPIAALLMAKFMTEKRLATFIALLITCLAIAAALQRTSLGALGVTLAVVALICGRGILRLVIALGCLMAVPAIILLNGTFRSRMFFEHQEAQSIVNNIGGAASLVNSSGRFELWQDVLHRFFLPNPIFGAGLGATEQYFYTSTGQGVAHSEYVRLLCETGIVGLVAFSIVLMSYMKLLVRGGRNDEFAPALKYKAAAAGSVVAYACYMTTDNAFDYVNQFGIYVFGLVAIAIKANELTLKVISPVSVPNTLRPENLLN